MGTFYELDGESNMMYTEGIRKIVTISRTGFPLSKCIDMASDMGYTALNHNGLIYVKVIDINDEEQWFLSPFTIEDFQAQ